MAKRREGVLTMEITKEWIAEQRASFCGAMNYRYGFYTIMRGDLKEMRRVIKLSLDAIERISAELSQARKAYVKLAGYHQRGVSAKIIPCPVCGGVECVRLLQRIDAPELFGLSCGECGSHATIQLFADSDDIERLTAELAAERKRADAAIADLECLASDVEGQNLACRFCSGDFEDTQQCNIGEEDEAPCFTWRGPCAENAPTGAESEVTP